MAPAACRRFRLGNGLRVLLLEDHRAPLVAVHVAYAAGAADEPDGRHGLAHLYEHLMYGGSANLPGAYLTHLTAAGAHDLNGRTGLDSTHYFETVHTQALEFALFAESDRMGHLLSALGEDTLERQRSVVGNELRQYRERADGRAQELLAEISHAPGHPYRHGIIGNEADLARIGLDDARDFGRRYYHPANAVLALAGDVDADRAQRWCERYFGAIPAGASTALASAVAAPLPAGLRIVDAIGGAGLQRYRVWNLPAPASRIDEHGQALLARLIEARLLATKPPVAFTLRHRPARLGAQLELSFGGADAAGLQAATRWFDLQWRQLLDAGFSQAEYAGARETLALALMQRLDSRHGLAEHLIELERYASADDAAALDADAVCSRQVLQQSARLWLGVAPHELERRPPRRAADAPAAPRRLPPPLVMPARIAEPPPLEHHRLANGLQLLVARRPGAALLAARLMLPGGSALEPPAQMGIAQLSASLLQLRQDTRDVALSDAATALGMELSADAQADCLRLAWTSAHHQSLAMLAAASRALTETAPFPADAVERMRERQLLRIADASTRAESATQRLLPALLFGAAHGRIADGLRSSVTALSLDDLAGFHRRQYRLPQAVCVLVGDPGADDLAAMSATPAAAHIGWPQPARVTQPAAVETAPLFVLDMPGSAQALVTVAWRLPAGDAVHQAELQLLDRLLAAGFSSLLNLRLREDLGWTYGVRSRLGDAAQTRHYEIQVWVPTQRAVDARAEILRAVEALSTRGVAAQALQGLQRSEALRRVAATERVVGLAQLLESRLRLGLLDTDAPLGLELLAALQPQAMRTAAARLLPVAGAVTLLAGDAAELRPQLERAQLDDHRITADAEALYRR